MSEEPKCPICGMPMDTGDGVGAYCTGTHIFQCDVLDLPRIATAMECARLKTAYHDLPDNAGDEEQRELWNELVAANNALLQAWQEE